MIQIEQVAHFVEYCKLSRPLLSVSGTVRLLPVDLLFVERPYATAREHREGIFMCPRFIDFNGKRGQGIITY